MEKDAREKLMEAGARLFAAKGFAAVSIRELAQEAETNSALISYYFGGKEGLYTAVLANQFESVNWILASVRESNLPPDEQVMAYARGILLVHQQNPYIIRFLYSELANPTPVFETIIQQQIQKVYRILHQTVSEGIACGRFRADLRPEHVVLALAGMMNFYFISRPIRSHFLPVEGEDDPRYIEDALKIYLDGVRQYGG